MFDALGGLFNVFVLLYLWFHVFRVSVCSSMDGLVVVD